MPRIPLLIMPKKSFMEFIQSIDKPKKIAMLVLSLASIILMILFPYWGLSMDGIHGIMEWVPPFRYIIYFFIAIGITLPFLYAADLIKSWKTENPKRVPSRFFWTFALIWIILPVGIFSFVTINQNTYAGDKPPQLLLEANDSQQIPNYVISFFTVEPTINEVQWGTTLSMEKTIVETTASREHAIRLTDLEPATQYFYQINGEGQIYNFTTPPNQSNRLTFAATSDFHAGTSNTDHSITQMIFDQIIDPAQNIDLFLACGDFVELGFRDAEWQEWIELVSPYSSHVPILPAIGNHDTIANGKHFFASYYSPTGMETNGGTEFYRHVRINDVNFIVLNLQWSVESFDDDQAAWLNATLESIPQNEWIVVLSHAYHYSSGVYLAGMQWGDDAAMIETFHDLFVEHGVDLVFSGHNHHLEVCEVDGVTYLTVGGAGSHRDGERNLVSEGSVWYSQGTYGFARIDIDGSTAFYQFIDENGVELYSGNTTISA